MATTTVPRGVGILQHMLQRVVNSICKHRHQKEFKMRTRIGGGVGCRVKIGVRVRKVANPDTQEFNQLMDQMRNLSLNDPQYSFLYVKMMHLDPQAARHLPEPIHNPPPRWAGPPPTRDPPPHILARPQPSLPPMRPPPPAVPPPSFTTGRPPPSTDGCYGCGTPGHMMSSCPQLQELIQKGVIRRDF